MNTLDRQPGATQPLAETCLNGGFGGPRAVNELRLRAESCGWCGWGCAISNNRFLCITSLPECTEGGRMHQIPRMDCSDLAGRSPFKRTVILPGNTLWT